jgi:hypothetical protein
MIMFVVDHVSFWGCCPNYTEADISKAWVNVSRLALFTSAFEGIAVMANPPRWP